MLGLQRTWLVCVLYARIATAGAYVHGAVCQNFSASMPSSRVLRDKHLRIGELNWAPFAKSDATAPHGFTGLNMDVYKQLCSSSAGERTRILIFPDHC